MISPEEVGQVPEPVRRRYERWSKFMSEEVRFSRRDPGIHGPDHCARVLL